MLEDCVSEFFFDERAKIATLESTGFVVQPRSTQAQSLCKFRPRSKDPHKRRQEVRKSEKASALNMLEVLTVRRQRFDVLILPI